MRSSETASVLLSRLRIPIVQAPLSGGPSTPELTIAVSRAGGFGFLARELRDALRAAAAVTDPW